MPFSNMSLALLNNVLSIREGGGGLGGGIYINIIYIIGGLTKVRKSARQILKEL